MRDRHAFGQARRARRENDLRRVHADLGHRGEGDGEQILERGRQQEVSPRLEPARLSRQQILGRDQRGHPRCFQDVFDLARSQRFVDDHRDAARGSHSEKRGENPDTVVGLESRRRQRRSDGGGTTLEGGIVRGPPTLDHCRERTPSTRRFPQQVGDIGDQTYLQHTRTASPVPRYARASFYIRVLRRRTT